MRKLFERYWLGPAAVGGLALAALISWILPPAKAQVVGPIAGVQCSHLAQASIAATTSSVLVIDGASGSQATVRGVAGRIIYVCGWHVTNNSATAGTFQFVGGTDAATTPGCGGTQTILTPAYDVTQTSPATDHTSFAVLNLPVGQQLCVTTSGATTLHVGVWIGQY